jgi:hypothetical protein
VSGDAEAGLVGTWNIPLTGVVYAVFLREAFLKRCSTLHTNADHIRGSLAFLASYMALPSIGCAGLGFQPREVLERLGTDSIVIAEGSEDGPNSALRGVL